MMPSAVVESTQSSTTGNENLACSPVNSVLAERFEEHLAAGKLYWHGDGYAELDDTVPEAASLDDEHPTKLDDCNTDNSAIHPVLQSSSTELSKLQSKMEALESHITLLTNVVNGQGSAITTTTILARQHLFSIWSVS